MNITGHIKLIKETQTFGNKGFQKRELVITTDDQYPQPILIEFHKEKCDILDNYSIGQKVEIGINLQGREWISPNGEIRYFNTFKGWQIKSV